MKDTDGIFAADLASNLLVVFLLVLAVLPYATQPSTPEKEPDVRRLLTGRAFVEALHDRATGARGPEAFVEIGRGTTGCVKAGGADRIEVVLDPPAMMRMLRAGCPSGAETRVMIVPASLKGPDGDWSPAMKGLFAAPGGLDRFRDELLRLLERGAEPSTDVPQTFSASLAALRDGLMRWRDFVTAMLALMLFFGWAKPAYERRRGPHA